VNRNFKILVVKKVSLLACLFLLIITVHAADPIWKFDTELQKAYQQVLNLQTEKANSILKQIHTNSLHKLYVQSLNETLYILIAEDPAQFVKTDQNFKDRIKYLEGLPQTAETLFLQAELSLQRGFCYLNLGQEFNAVVSIRKAYQLTSECIKKYPSFIPIKKTYGTLQVMVGTVPDKYQWFMSLIGMKGSVVVGQKQLSDLRNSASSLNLEATLLFFTIKGFINQQFAEAAAGINTCLKDQPDNRLLLFIGVNMLMKDGRSEEALALAHELEKQKDGLPVHYIDYLHAEILIQKGEYTKAISYYNQFIKNFPSDSFKKDSYYKISLSYWLQGDTRNAKLFADKARITGNDKAEPDQHAAIQLLDESFPNKKLLKARYAIDGGYYKEATAILNSVTPAELSTLKDQTEFYYRKARLAHRTGEIATAKVYYKQSIDMTKNSPWYFGANSALQLGYIAKAQNDIDNARRYFQLAMTYPKHEYKTSIDSKARTELEQLSTAKA
jgi:tetratricopeptide (TPR) repeat protein